jgi:hypothetical protein
MYFIVEEVAVSGSSKVRLSVLGYNVILWCLYILWKIFSTFKYFMIIFIEYMPRRCCVPGCKSNYDSTLEGCAPVSTFGFPKDPKRRELWLRAIPRKDWIPSSASAVCVLHFEESDVIKTQKFKNVNGVVENIPLAFPKLCDDAVPRMFENLPVYLMKEKGTPRREPDAGVGSYWSVITSR